VIDDEFEKFIKELSSFATETECVEFKRNKADHQEIGKNVSALANSAALLRKHCGYVVWGVEDVGHAIVGTNFKPRETKIGNEELENWMLHNLEPKIDIKIHEGKVEDKHVVLFEVQAAGNRPIRFKDTEYIRVGTYTKKLRDYPEKERNLWRIFDRVNFEDGIAKKDIHSDDVLSLIDYPNYFGMLKDPLPDNRAAILQRLISDKIIVSAIGDRYDITNVGAILFAKDLNDFAACHAKHYELLFILALIVPQPLKNLLYQKVML